MLITAIVLLVVLSLALTREVHALGIWVTMMIIHGLLVEIFGESVIHLPLFAGLGIVGITLARGKWKIANDNMLLMFMGLIAVMFIAGLVGFDPDKSMLRILLYVKGFILAIFVAGVVKSNYEIKVISIYFLVGIFVGVWVAFYQYFTGAYTVDTINIQRVAGLTKDPNDVATLLLSGLPLALYWATHVKSDHFRFVIYTFCLTILGAVVLTQSRGAFVATLILMGILFFRKPSWKAAIAGMVVALAVAVISPSTYWERMGTLVTGQEIHGGKSLDTRANYIKKGLDALIDNPLLGVGPGNFGEAVYDPVGAVGIKYQHESISKAAHNMYLEFFVENGLSGGILFLCLLGFPFLAAFVHPINRIAETSVFGLGFCVAMSLLAILLSGLFLSQGKSSVLWFLVGLAYAIGSLKVVRNPSSGEEPDVTKSSQLAETGK